MKPLKFFSGVAAVAAAAVEARHWRSDEQKLQTAYRELNTEYRSQRSLGNPVIGISGQSGDASVTERDRLFYAPTPKTETDLSMRAFRFCSAHAFKGNDSRVYMLSTPPSAALNIVRIKYDPLSGDIPKEFISPPKDADAVCDASCYLTKKGILRLATPHSVSVTPPKSVLKSASNFIRVISP